MSSPAKSSKKGILILSIGLFIGLVLGVTASCIVIGHMTAHAKPSNSTVTAARPDSDPLPIPLPPPPESAPLYAAPQMQGFQQMPATSYTQDGTTYTTVSSFKPGAGPELAEFAPAGNGDNPNWTVGHNGLVQNPCVDPPSSHGRAYRVTGQY